MASSIIMLTLDRTDKKILKLAQGDLPVCEEPFVLWAEEVGILQDELIDRLKKMKDAGIIRDFKAILRHVEAGVSANAMVTWAVEESKVDEAGEMLAGFEAITHCYERPDFGRFNMFTMIHARTKEDLLKKIKEISEKTGLSDYQIHWSKREFKKTSMQYF
jgi:siroheme decarboxylase